MNDRGQGGEGQELSNWQMEKMGRYCRPKGGTGLGKREAGRDGWLVRVQLEMRWLKRF